MAQLYAPHYNGVPQFNLPERKGSLDVVTQFNNLMNSMAEEQRKKESHPLLQAMNQARTDFLNKQVGAFDENNELNNLLTKAGIEGKNLTNDKVKLENEATQKLMQRQDKFYEDVLNAYGITPEFDNYQRARNMLDRSQGNNSINQFVREMFFRANLNRNGNASQTTNNNSGQINGNTNEANTDSNAYSDDRDKLLALMGKYGSGAKTDKEALTSMYEGAYALRNEDDDLVSLANEIFKGSHDESDIRYMDIITDPDTKEIYKYPIDPETGKVDDSVRGQYTTQLRNIMSRYPGLAEYSQYYQRVPDSVDLSHFGQGVGKEYLNVFSDGKWRKARTDGNNIGSTEMSRNFRKLYNDVQKGSAGDYLENNQRKINTLYSDLTQHLATDHQKTKVKELNELLSDSQNGRRNQLLFGTLATIFDKVNLGQTDSGIDFVTTLLKDPSIEGLNKSLFNKKFSGFGANDWDVKNIIKLAFKNILDYSNQNNLSNLGAKDNAIRAVLKMKNNGDPTKVSDVQFEILPRYDFLLNAQSISDTLETKREKELNPVNVSVSELTPDELSSLVNAYFND